MNEVINALSTQRKNLDAIKIAINKLPNSRGKALGFTALEKGRMFIGEISRELGTQYPYEETKKATTAKEIQPAIDLADDSTPAIKLVSNEIVNLNTIREILAKELNWFESLVFDAKKGLVAKQTKQSIKSKFVMDCNISEAYRSLKESRMWLGIRLGELRDNANK